MSIKWGQNGDKMAIKWRKNAIKQNKMATKWGQMATKCDKNWVKMR